MPRLIGIYEYRFVRPDFTGDDAGNPWEHIGIVMRREAPGGVAITLEKIAWATNEFAEQMAKNAATWDEAAGECMASSHTRPAWAPRPPGAARDGLVRCRDLPSDEHYCVRRAREARACCRTDERTMLVRVERRDLMSDWPR